MRKVLLIAKRDYLQTVSSKAFLFGLIMLPLLFGISFLAISISNRGNMKDQRIVVIDHTGVSGVTVIQACEESNRKANSSATGLQVKPHFAYEEVTPSADEAVQLLFLADRVRRGVVYLVLDIPADALDPPADAKQQVRYYSNATGVNQLALWLPAAVNDGLHRVRLMRAGMDAARASGILEDASVDAAAGIRRSKDSLTATTGAQAKKRSARSKAR